MPKLQKRQKPAGVIDWQEELKDPNSTYFKLVTSLVQAGHTKNQILQILMLRATQVIAEKEVKQKEALQKAQQPNTEKNQEKVNEAAQNQYLEKARALERQRQIEHDQRLEALKQQTTEELESQFAEVEETINQLTEEISSLENKFAEEEQEIAAVSNELTIQRQEDNNKIIAAVNNRTIVIVNKEGIQLSQSEAVRRLQEIHEQQPSILERVNYEQLQRWMIDNPNGSTTQFVNDIYQAETVALAAQYSAELISPNGESTVAETTESTFNNKPIIDLLLSVREKSEKKEIAQLTKVADLLQGQHATKEDILSLQSKLKDAVFHQSNLNKNLNKTDNSMQHKRSKE